MLESILKNQGLTGREITAYTLLLEFGEQPVSLIAKKLGVSRSSCYALLNGLLEKGMAAQINKNGTAFFMSVDPAALLDTAARKRREELNQISTLKLNLNFLRRQNSFQEPKSAARYFQGQDGLESLINQILAHDAPVKRIYLSMADGTRGPVLDVLSQKAKTGARASSGTDTGAKSGANHVANPDVNQAAATEALKIITVKRAGGDKAESDNSALTGGRSLPGANTRPNSPSQSICTPLSSHESLPGCALVKKVPAAFDLGIDLIISGDRIAVLSQPENFGLMIESRLIAAAQAKIFDLAWRLAKS